MLRYTLYPDTVDVLGVQFRSTLCCGAAMPVPLRFSVNGDPAALVTNDTVAGADPVDWGVNVMVKLAVCPAGIVSGRVGPLIRYSALLTEADVTMTLALVALSVAVML